MIKSEEEIRKRREDLVQSKHDYYGCSVDGLDLYYYLRDMLDWVLGEEKKD